MRTRIGEVTGLALVGVPKKPAKSTGQSNPSAFLEFLCAPRALTPQMVHATLPVSRSNDGS
jgi:hypothetical protein